MSNKDVKLNTPIRSPEGSNKKFHVFVRDKSGKIRKVSFGDPNMKIKRYSDTHLNSFRARHDCDSANDKTTPRHWSCKMWEKDKTVSDVLSENKLPDFKTFLEQYQIPNDHIFNLGVERINMPQVDNEKLQNDLKSDNINHEFIEQPTAMLIPTQGEFNDEKISKIIDGINKNEVKSPILVSSDNFIVDGHHRWAAFHNTVGKVPSMKIHLNIEDLLNYLQQKDYIMKRGINENSTESRQQVISENLYNILNEMNIIDNMRRQLMDLMRVRIEKGNVTDENKSKSIEHVKNIIKGMDENEVRKEYNTQVINSTLYPITYKDVPTTDE